MEEIKYDIKYDEAVNRWWITKMQKACFEAPYQAFEAEVNLGEDYVQIVYPVREAFLRENKIKEVNYYQGNYPRMYFPFENNRVDFTTFIHSPHHIWVNAKTFLKATKEGIFPFEVYTCGGMKIWVNQKEVLCFTPYTRNIPQKYEVNLELHEGLNEIVVYADELAERDVFFYYEIRYKGHQQLEGVVPVEKDAGSIIRTENFLKSCYFERDCYATGNLYLKYDNALLQEDMTLYISGDPTGAPLTEADVTIKKRVSKEDNQVDIGKIDTFNVGVFKIFIASHVGEFQINRELVVGIIPEMFTDFKPKKTLKERKEQALNFVAQYGETVVNRTMAILKIEKEMTPKAMECLNNSIEKIRRKEDCADFYLVPIFLMLKKYSHYLCADKMEEIKKIIIDFRYWIDEPGNDVMWYFSENHALLFHISQYLAGNMFKEDTFLVSQRTGEEQLKIGKKRIEEWFEIFFKYGYAEWNSATYIPIDLIGFFVLYEMAPDAHIRKLAKEAIDFTFKIITYNTFNGIMSSSYGRAYEDTLKAREQVETSFIEWISYGKGFVNSRCRAVSLYCLSTYEPPDYNQEVTLNDKEWMSVELDQGINQIKTYNFKTKDYFIACVRRFKPFIHGHQQHVMNVALGEKSVQFYLNHPGEKSFSGGNRPSYWAGNGTIPFVEQYKNIMIILYHIDKEELVHYIHASITLYLYDEHELTNNWFFAKIGNAYLGVYFSEGVHLTIEGANTLKEVTSEGLNHAIIVKCGSYIEFGSFERFKEKLKEVEVKYDGAEGLKFEDPQYGYFEVQDRKHILINNHLLDYKITPHMVVTKGKL